jgi:hypothetical protein
VFHERDPLLLRGFTLGMYLEAGCPGRCDRGMQPEYCTAHCGSAGLRANLVAFSGFTVVKERGSQVRVKRRDRRATNSLPLVAGISALHSQLERLCFHLEWLDPLRPESW